MRGWGTNATLRAAGGFSISHCSVWVEWLSVWFWDLRSVGVIAYVSVWTVEERVVGGGKERRCNSFLGIK